MIKFLILIFLYPTFSLALDCETPLFYTIEKKQYEFCISEKLKIIINKDCTKSCLALSANDLIKNKFKEINMEELHGGKNPSSVICKHVEGIALKGISPTGDQEYFCKLNDNSLISFSSLHNLFQEI